MVPNQDPKAYRLPAHVVPVRYDLHLRADPASPQFSAEVAVHLRLLEETAEVVLHNNGLEILVATLETSEGEQALEVASQPERETVTLTPRQAVGSGDARLRISYAGKVNQAMEGLYLSADAEDRCLATQCEATDARRIVPCFDEPTYKARWHWTVTTTAGNRVYTNGILKDERTNDDGTVTYRFEPTTPISSYLIACAIGAFGETEPAVTRGVPHRVLAMGGREQYGIHGRDLAVRLQEWYEDYFFVPYPFGKYDQVAVPSFSFGAMENPGLVVFRASLLLLNEQTAAWRERKSVDLVVAHEFAHMWFGNLVTMRWWDDLWLNEAFAEWIAHKAVDELEPTHEIWQPFQSRAAAAMETDALDSTHAIYHPVATPDEAQEMFDAITYGKGSATMRMIEGFLGADNFRNGLRSYMQAFKEKNAAGSDLWNHLAQASDQPVGKIMQNWIGQPGHPAVSVSVDRSDGLRLRLRQARAHNKPDAPEGDQLWAVPMVIRYADDTGEHEVRHLFDGRDSELRLDAQGALKWCYPNGDDVGFYRTVPDDTLRAGWAEHYDALTPSERRGILRDQWSLVQTGRLPIQQYLALLDTALPHETHYAVTEELVVALRELERILEHHGDPAALDAYRAWVGEKVRPTWESLDGTVASDDPAEAQRRAAILRALAGIARDPQALEAARRIAADERRDPREVDPNLASTAVSLTAAFADTAGYETHLATYRDRRSKGASPQEVERYLYTLASFRDPALIERTLKLLDEDGVPKQAVGPLLRMMLHEPHAQGQAWPYVKRIWDDVRPQIGDAWAVILVEATGALPPAVEKDVIGFLERKLDGFAGESHKRAVESLETRRGLYARVLEPLAVWAKEKA